MAKNKEIDLLEFLGWKEYPCGGLTWPGNLSFIFKEAVSKGLEEITFTKAEFEEYLKNLEDITKRENSINKPKIKL